MRSYEDRAQAQRHSQTPPDIAKLNNLIIQQGSTEGLTELFRDNLKHSWNGVAGQFKESRVEVDPALVSKGGRNVGYLGKISVAEVEIENTWDPDEDTYVGPSFVVELKHPRLWGQFGEPSSVVLAVPDYDSVVFPISRTTFFRRKH